MVKNQNDLIQAYAYLRVSSQIQIEGNGFDRQLEKIKAFADSAGIEIIDVYREEGVSGTKDAEDRPAFKSMMTDILSNGVRVVVVESLDRLAREYRIQESLLIFMLAKGVALYSANTGENVTEAIGADPMRKALVQVQGIFSELDRSLLVQKLTKAKDMIRATGKKVEGRKAYGEGNPEELLVIKRIKLMRRKRRGGYKPPTYQQIADILNAEGITTKDGKKWTRGQVFTMSKR